MPKYKTLHRRNFSPEQAELSNRLRIIQAAAPWKRQALISALAIERAVTDRTVRRWIAKNLDSPEMLLNRKKRSDIGSFRLPEASVRCILNFFWENPEVSSARAYTHLLSAHADLMTYADAKGKPRTISIGSVRRIQRIFRHGWDAELKRTKSLI